MFSDGVVLQLIVSIEGLVAIRLDAPEDLVAPMSPLVLLKVSTRSEPLLTVSTLEGLFTSVGPEMHLQIGEACEQLPTNLGGPLQLKVIIGV